MAASSAKVRATPPDASDDPSTSSRKCHANFSSLKEREREREGVAFYWKKKYAVNFDSSKRTDTKQVRAKYESNASTSDVTRDPCCTAAYIPGALKLEAR